MNDSEQPQPQPPQLSAIELRVLGCLMEKQLTTPDQYPLTVNSILSACNQKSSREPITSYEQGEVVRTLQALDDKNFVRKEYGSRADKYTQQFMHHLELSKKHQAVLSLLMLRGPQTLSELSTRTQRMDVFTDKNELLHCVERLCERELPYAIRLSSHAGQRGERFAHLFSGTPDFDHNQPVASVRETAATKNHENQEMLALLESEISDLNKSVATLKDENAVLKTQLAHLYELTGHELPG